MSLSRFKLIRRNIARKKTRSFLLITSIAIAFFIFATLAGFETGFNGGEVASERLIVSSKVSSAQSLPFRHINKLQKVSGIEAITYMARMRATYRAPDNFIGVNAVEPDSYVQFFQGEYIFDPAHLAALDKQRNGVIVGRGLALREGLVIGQRFNVTSLSYRTQTGSPDWEFQIVGFFDAARASADTNFVMARYDYVNSTRNTDRDTVTYFGVLPKPSVRADTVIRQIDDSFANSAYETRTRTETEFMRAFVAQFADVTTIVRLVVGASFVTILMIVANTMFFAIKERTQEIGVLKVLGFSRQFILVSILVETITLFALGLLVGLVGAWVAMNALRGPMGTLVPNLSLTPEIVLQAAGLALLFALLTGLIPAINAMRLSVLDALKQR